MALIVCKIRMAPGRGSRLWLLKVGWRDRAHARGTKWLLVFCSWQAHCVLQNNDRQPNISSSTSSSSHPRAQSPTTYSKYIDLPTCLTTLDFGGNARTCHSCQPRLPSGTLSIRSRRLRTATGRVVSPQATAFATTLADAASQQLVSDGQLEKGFFQAKQHKPQRRSRYLPSCIRARLKYRAKHKDSQPVGRTTRDSTTTHYTHRRLLFDQNDCCAAALFSAVPLAHTLAALCFVLLPYHASFQLDTDQ